MTDNYSSQPPAQGGSSNANLMAVLAHATVFTGFLFPLIFWLVGKDQSSFVDTEGKKALNFGILVTIGYAIATVIGYLPVIGWLSGLVSIAVFLIAVIFGIQGAVAASKGNGYRYPFTIDLIK